MIGAYRGVSAVSRIIRRWSWHDYSHISEIHPLIGSVVEAWHQPFPRGAVRECKSYHYGHTPGTVIICFKVRGMSDEAERGVYQRMLTQKGKRYDFHGIAGFISRRDGAQNQEKWFCSELSMWGHAEEGFRLLERVPWSRVTPGAEVTTPIIDEIGHLVVGEDMEALAHGMPAEVIARRRGIYVPPKERKKEAHRGPTRRSKGSDAPRDGAKCSEQYASLARSMQAGSGLWLGDQQEAWV